MTTAAVYLSRCSRSTVAAPVANNVDAVTDTDLARDVMPPTLDVVHLGADTFSRWCRDCTRFPGRPPPSPGAGAVHVPSGHPPPSRGDGPCPSVWATATFSRCRRRACLSGASARSLPCLRRPRRVRVARTPLVGRPGAFVGPARTPRSPSSGASARSPPCRRRLVRWRRGTFSVAPAPNAKRSTRSTHNAYSAGSCGAYSSLSADPTLSPRRWRLGTFSPCRRHSTAPSPPRRLNSSALERLIPDGPAPIVLVLLDAGLKPGLDVLALLDAGLGLDVLVLLDARVAGCLEAMATLASISNFDST